MSVPCRYCCQSRGNVGHPRNKSDPYLFTCSFPGDDLIFFRVDVFRNSRNSINDSRTQSGSVANNAIAFDKGTASWVELPRFCGLQTNRPFENAAGSRELSGSHSFHEATKSKLEQIFLLNDYPSDLIKQQIKKAEKSIVYQKPKENGNNKTYVSLPYNKLWENPFTKTFGNKNMTIGWQYKNKMHNYYPRIKSAEPLLESRFNVYKIPCKNCDQMYIGESLQNLRKRLQQHSRNITNKQQKTALDRHMLETGHLPDFDNVTSLGKHNNTTNRRILENIHIIKNSALTMNIQSDLMNLGEQFYPLFRKNHTRRKNLGASAPAPD
ncbi:unnamed protein product [Nesidiocoris tenuis]|uniref:GIY-YIG domain-containing protein n=1 Tax=Nesidiocoris tenuis TaxID=355587 RepID=A0A6H5HCP7_9HEMI|nr:unnamed protein product [Nesidiocoris tenuis]